MTQRETDIKWIKNHLGDSFESGLWIKGRVARVKLTDGRKINVSLPDKNIKGYSNG